MVLLTIDDTDTLVGSFEVINGECVVYTYAELLTSKINVLKKMGNLRFVCIGQGAQKGIDIEVTDGDDNEDVVNVGPLYDRYEGKGFKTLNVLEGLDSDENVALKNKMIGMVKNAFGEYNLTVVDFEKLLNSRIDVSKQLEGCNFFIDKVDSLKCQNILANTDESTKKLISELVEKYSEKWENRVLCDEQEKVYFKPTPDMSLVPNIYKAKSKFFQNGNAIPVMPDYDTVSSVETGSIDEILMRSMVPEYTRYIGGYVNYVIGSVGEPSMYTTLQNAFTPESSIAELLNRVNYKSSFSAEKNGTLLATLGKTQCGITEEFIIGNSEYDDDGIRENEEEYFNTLCKFVDECFERDMLEAPIHEWIALGLKVGDYGITNQAQKAVSFSEIDVNTGEVIKEGDKNGKGYTLKDLENIGLTVDVFKGLGAGSPTSNKWMMYAINVALAATRAYTGFIPVPMGYDSFEFNKSEKVWGPSVRKKYAALVNNGEAFSNGGFKSLDSIIGNSDNSKFEDIYELASDFASEYWFHVTVDTESDPDDVNKDSNANKSESGNASYDSQYIFNEEPLVGQKVPQDILGTIFYYCKGAKAGYIYSFAEALIKCLRFGRKKPRCLKIADVASKVDLTTGELIKMIDYSNPAPVADDKKYRVLFVVTSSSLSESVKTELREQCGIKCEEKSSFVVGVGLEGRYLQPEDKIVSVCKYVDLETLLSDSELMDNIYGMSDGQLAVKDAKLAPRVEDVSNVITKLSGTSPIYSVQLNENIYKQVIEPHLDVMDVNNRNAKVLNKMCKDGYDLFTLAGALTDLDVDKTCLEYMEMGALNKYLNNERANIKRTLNTELLTRYGKAIVEDLTFQSEDIVEKLNNALALWKDKEELGFTVVAKQGASNTKNVEYTVDNFKEELNDLGLPSTGYHCVALTIGEDVIGYLLQSTSEVEIDNGGKKSSKKAIVFVGRTTLKKDVFSEFANSIGSKCIKKKFNFIADGIKTAKSKRPNLTLESVVDKMVICFNNDSKKILIEALQ